MLWRSQRPGKRPGLIEPCIPTVAAKPPVGPQWVHEIKHDGYRMIVRKREARVRLFTRRGFDWSERYPRIVKALAGLATASVTIDGEAVYCDASGVAVFDKLHSRAYDDQVILYAFDLLEIDGEDWRPRPLEARKARLEKLLKNGLSRTGKSGGKVLSSGIHFNEHLAGDGAAIFAHACKLGLEGIVSKHRERAYRSGPSRAWLKIKNPQAPGVLRFHDEP